MKKISASLATLVLILGIAGSFGAAASQDSTPITLGTQTGFDIGGQISGYDYKEHMNSNQFLMEEFGPQYGITGTATKSFANTGFFVSADGRFAYGQNQYNGSGTKNNVEDLLWDVRLLGGRDFVFDQYNGINWSIAPYTGIGYRNLFNDLRGTTSDGAQGYRRHDEYLYLPVGITPRFRVTDTSRISTNLEYDYLIKGWQTSALGDAIPGATDLVNHQNSGYGLRGSIMYEWSNWSVGPFADYWNVNASSVACDNVGCGFEPHNQTIEAGLQLHYHF